ncbi:MAG: porin family protein [Gammaproteobacteria bacterium]|nr:porin family protein [Gammaproteobacteria bacterium]
MKSLNVVSTYTIIGTFLIVGLSIPVNAKEAGIYLHGGATYWRDLEVPEVIDLTELRHTPIEYEVVESRTRPSIAVGYNFDENWGVELLYLSTPKRTLTFNQMIEPGDDDDIIRTLTWRNTVQHTTYGINVVYDVNISNNFSVFGKLGIAQSSHAVDSSITFSGRTNPAPEELYGFVEEVDTEDLFGAIGARIPVKNIFASLSVAYQFVETSDGRESSFEVAIQMKF